MFVGILAKRPNITVGMLSPTNYDEPNYLRKTK